MDILCKQTLRDIDINNEELETKTQLKNISPISHAFGQK